MSVAQVFTANVSLNDLNSQVKLESSNEVVAGFDDCSHYGLLTERVTPVAMVVARIQPAAVKP